MFCTFRLIAQTENDAMRYSFTAPIGTARSTSMGGAYGAVGADLFSPVVNPAGIGLYRRSEFVVSPGLFASSTSSQYYGNKNVDDKFKINMPNWGFVFNSKVGKDDDLNEWKSYSIAFSRNILNDFSQRIFIAGQTQNKSIVDAFLANSNGKAPDQLDQFSDLLAFDTYLIDTFYVLGTNNYVGQIYNNPKINQTKYINRSGALSESAFTLSGNYSNKLFVGGSLGFKRVNFLENSQYGEKVMDTIGLRQLNFNNSYSTNGGGFFVKIGAIVQPVNWVRLGLSLHSGCRLNLTDSYSSDLEAVYKTGSISSKSPQGGYDYTIKTPGKIAASLALLNSKIGMLSVDYEIMNYKNARIYPNSVFSDVNQTINNGFSLSQTLRVGGEIKINSNYSFRIGYSNSTSPYSLSKNSLQLNRYSGGFGYRKDWFFVDIAFVLSRYSENYYAYNPSLIEAAKVNFDGRNFISTIGFRF